jgi:DNA-directed RNA polymerase specialized sigma subunit
MKFQEAVESSDVVKIANFAYKKYKELIPIDEKKQLIHTAIWRACECYNPDKGASFLTYVHNRVQFACRSYLKHENARKAKSVELLFTDYIKQQSQRPSDISCFYNTDIPVFEFLDSIQNKTKKELIEDIYVHNLTISEAARQRNRTDHSIVKELKSIFRCIKK